MRRWSTKKALLIGGGITAATIIIVTVILVSLVLTVLKPKDPLLIPHPTKLENVTMTIFPLSMNATLSMIITIHNPNYGSFHFKDTNSSVNYRGNLLTQIPIQGATVPSRSAVNITTSANITTEKLVTSPYFIKDLESGHLNFTSVSDMHGKVSFLKIFKFGATVFSSCDITIYINSYVVDASCHSNLKL